MWNLGIGEMSKALKWLSFFFFLNPRAYQGLGEENTEQQLSAGNLIQGNVIRLDLQSPFGLQHGIELSEPTSPRFGKLLSSGWGPRFPAATTSFSRLWHGSDYSGSFSGGPGQAAPPPKWMLSPSASPYHVIKREKYRVMQWIPTGWGRNKKEKHSPNPQIFPKSVQQLEDLKWNSYPWDKGQARRQHNYRR